MDPEIAEALLADHLESFFMYSPLVAANPDQWCWHSCASGVQAVVGIPARKESGSSAQRIFHVLIDATYYDTAPVKIMFVSPYAAGNRGNGDGTDAPAGITNDRGVSVALVARVPTSARDVRGPGAGCQAAPMAFDGWIRARAGTAAFPWIAGSPNAPQSEPRVPFQFALHDDYTYPDGRHDQLICFSYSFDYYASHTPAGGQAWRAGRDRLDATLGRLHEILNSACYLGADYEEVA